MKDHEVMNANREKADQAAKESMLRQMGRSRHSEARLTDTGAPVTLRELAQELQMDRSAARRYILRLGHKPARARTAESGYQEALVFTRAQADAIVAARRADGYC